MVQKADSGTFANACTLLIILIAAIVTRGCLIGDPAIEMDEQFYLLVADRMWHGALPYVDIWDRKPILLFLIYAALRPFSHDGIIACQIGALIFASMTAYVIVLIARRFANPFGALLAGVAYLLYLPLIGGGGGQSPVFYNLFMAIGAWEVLRAEETGNADGVWRHGLRAMLWTGLAIQVKYTAAIEGLAYGLCLIALLIRYNRRVLSRILMQAGLWVAVALTPTVLATAFYAMIGHGPAFFAANFLSIFQVREPDGFSSIGFLRASAMRLAPLMVIAVLSLPLLLRRVAAGTPRLFLLLWTAFAIVDFFAIGNYYTHYALPLAVPMAVVCAPLLGTPIGGTSAIVLFGWLAILSTGFPSGTVRQVDEQHIAAMVNAVRPYAGRGCIYMNDGPTIVYLLAQSCLPTAYVFPEHLNNAAESRATHSVSGMFDLLETRPSAIFVADKPLNHPRNAVTAAILDAALAKTYTRVTSMPDVFPWRQQTLYVRNDLLPKSETPH